MANAHITAAIQCSQFKGTTRLVLLYLANAASPGSKNREEENKKILPLGYCKRRLSTIMAGVNIHRQPTVTAAIKQLRDSGVIKQWLKKGASPIYFVDLDWLKAHAYTEAELEQFDYDALKDSRKAFNQENGNRLTSNTESVFQEYGNRLTLTDLEPPTAQGVFPPTGVGFFSTPSGYTDKDSPVKDTQDQTYQGQPPASNTRDFAPHPTGDFSPPDPPAAATQRQNEESPAAVRHPKYVCQKCGGPVRNNKIDGVCLKCGFDPNHRTEPYIEPTGVHNWPVPLRERTNETLCVNGCGAEWGDRIINRENFKWCSKAGGKSAVADS